VTAPVFVLRPEELADATVGATVRVSGAEGRHAVTVMRTTVGETVSLVDGEGRRLTGPVTAVIGKASLDVDVAEVQFDPSPTLRVTVAQALAKGDRGELAVAQLTEIGVDEILPWSAAHSVVHWRGDRAEKSSRRWADAITAAAKQSRRSRFPVLGGLTSTNDLRLRVSEAALAVVLHEDATEAIGGLTVPASGELLVVVGPEGGISADELAVLAQAGARTVRMGPTVLRTSSAGLAAVAVLLSATNRWSGDGVGG